MPYALAPLTNGVSSGRGLSGRTAMIQRANVSLDRLWQRVSDEAESALARDPRFGRSLSAAILEQPGLGDAVAHQIGERLGKHGDDSRLFARVAREAYRASPDLIEAAGADLQSIAVHDPASTALLPPLLNFKGYVALQAWRCRTGSGVATAAIWRC